MASANVLTELGYLCEAHVAELLGHLLRRHPGVFAPRREVAIDDHRAAADVGPGHVDAKLEPPPDGAIKQLGMIGCRDGDDVAGKLVQLHQKEGNDPLDLAGLADVASLLPDRIELVEEEDAGRIARVIEQTSRAFVSPR